MSNYRISCSKLLNSSVSKNSARLEVYIKGPLVGRCVASPGACRCKFFKAPLCKGSCRRSRLRDCSLLQPFRLAYGEPPPLTQGRFCYIVIYLFSCKSCKAPSIAATTKAVNVQFFPRIAFSISSTKLFGIRIVLFVVDGITGISKVNIVQSPIFFLIRYFILFTYIMRGIHPSFRKNTLFLRKIPTVQFKKVTFIKQKQKLCAKLLFVCRRINPTLC